MTVLMLIPSWWLVPARVSARAAVANVQVVVPLARCASEFPVALEPVGRQDGGEPLVEAGDVAPPSPHAVDQGGAVGAAHATGVEVLHHQPLAVFGGTENADRVRDDV